MPIWVPAWRLRSYRNWLTLCAYASSPQRRPTKCSAYRSAKLRRHLNLLKKLIVERIAAPISRTTKRLSTGNVSNTTAVRLLWRDSHKPPVTLLADPDFKKPCYQTDAVLHWIMGWQTIPLDHLSASQYYLEFFTVFEGNSRWLNITNCIPVFRNHFLLHTRDVAFNRASILTTPAIILAVSWPEFSIITSWLMALNYSPDYPDTATSPLQ